MVLLIIMRLFYNLSELFNSHYMKNSNSLFQIILALIYYKIRFLLKSFFMKNKVLPLNDCILLSICNICYSSSIHFKFLISLVVMASFAAMKKEEKIPETRCQTSQFLQTTNLIYISSFIRSNYIFILFQRTNLERAFNVLQSEGLIHSLFNFKDQIIRKCIFCAPICILSK